MKKFGLDTGANYLDCGSGFGTHAVPLARAGRQVTVVEFNRQLVSQLRSSLKAAELERLQIEEADIQQLLPTAPAEKWDVVLCAGDTLTHMNSKANARIVVSEAARVLVKGGRLAVEYRDSSQLRLEGTSRFLPVRRDGQRSMHCFLEVLDAERLRVTDIITDVGAQGPETRFSDYVKVRIGVDELRQWIESAGMEVIDEATERGMTTIVAAKR